MKRGSREWTDGDWLLHAAFPDGFCSYQDSDWTYFGGGGVRLPSPYIPEVRDNIRDSMRGYRDGYRVPAKESAFQEWRLQRADSTWTPAETFFVLDDRPFNARFCRLVMRRWPGGSWSIQDGGLWRVGYYAVKGEAKAFVGQVCMNVAHEIVTEVATTAA